MPTLPVRALTRGKKRKKKPEDKSFTTDVSLVGFCPEMVSVTLDIQAPHKLSWIENIHVASGAADVDASGDEVAALPKGSCTLYIYPTIATDEEPDGTQPSELGLRVLRELIVQISKDTDAFDAADPVGAYPIHALLVCNTPASLEVSMEIFQTRPMLLTQVHTPDGPFRGESSLHICAVNRREQTLIELVELAVARLPAADAEQVRVGWLGPCDPPCRNCRARHQLRDCR